MKNGVDERVEVVMRLAMHSIRILSEMAQQPDASLREYLEAKKFAQIMEALVVDLGEARPDDVYGFVEQWAAKRSGGGRSASTEANSASNVALDGAIVNTKRTWDAIEDKAAIGKLFFEVLFTQHASLKNKLFRDIDIEAVTPIFVGLLDRAIMGDCTAEELRSTAEAASAGRGVSQRHFHYFLTSLLTAFSITFGTGWLAASEPFRVTLTLIMDELMAGCGVRESGAAPSATPQADFDTLAIDWAACDAKEAAAHTFFELLFTQHPTLKKRLFADVDAATLEPLLVSTFTAAMNSEIQLADLTALGKTYSEGKVVTPRHFMYFLSSALAALSTHVANFRDNNDMWVARVTTLLEAVTAGAVSADPRDEGTNAGMMMMSMRGTSPGAAPRGESPIPAAEDHGEDLPKVVASWKALSAEQHGEVTERFFQLLFLQHGSMKRKLFKGVDIESIKPRFAAAFDGYLAGKVSAAELTKLAAEHGAGRGVEEHHFDYFLTALLGALSAVMGREAFAPVAEPWRCVLTWDIAKAVKEGAPPADSAKVVAPSL
jgi:hemoglobin-like flavoprotein